MKKMMVTVLVATAFLASVGAASAGSSSAFDAARTLAVMKLNGFSHGGMLRATPVQQVYGQRCVTQVGWCPINPQPVGSPCRCGDVTGTTLQ